MFTLTSSEAGILLYECKFSSLGTVFAPTLQVLTNPGVINV